MGTRCRCRERNPSHWLYPNRSDLEPGIALGLETSAAINNSEAVLSFKGANECRVNSTRIFDVEAFIHHYYTEKSFWRRLPRNRLVSPNFQS
ncbi:hypothetical protein CDAR_101191 [Caerostris darwini]|uniref:Uncharacterized protein n=1 Tax=Caerostris darwini TaxID=1538125 RepID=A0AAV4QEB6_9ARAC|nr:hypothetical protein CDAR_101191 [Caerostris darwini]